MSLFDLIKYGCMLKNSNLASMVELDFWCEYMDFDVNGSQKQHYNLRIMDCVDLAWEGIP